MSLPPISSDFQSPYLHHEVPFSKKALQNHTENYSFDKVLFLEELINSKPGNLFEIKDKINNLCDVEKQKIIMLFIDSASSGLIHKLCQELDSFELTPTHKSEVLACLIQKAPITCIRCLELNPEQVVEAAMRGMKHDFYKIVTLIENHQLKITGEIHQVQFAELLIDMATEDDEFGISPMLFGLFLYLNDLSEESYKHLVDTILKQNGPCSLHRFIQKVVCHPEFFANCNFYIHIVKSIKKYIQDEPSQFNEIMRSVFEKLLNTIDLKDSEVFFKSINAFLVDQEKMLAFKAVLDAKTDNDALSCNPFEFDAFIILFFEHICFQDKFHRTDSLIHYLKMYPCTFVKNYKSFKVSEDVTKGSLAYEIAKINPELICSHLVDFEIQDTQILRKLGLCIFKQDPQLAMSYLPQFHISSIEEFHFEEINELKTLSEEALETALQAKYYEIHHPTMLELIGRELVKKYKVLTQDYEIHWAARFLEKAACGYQKTNDIDKVLALRRELSEMPLICETNPLKELDDRLNAQLKLQGNQGALNFGAPFQYMGSNQLKGGCFYVRNISIDGIPYREVYFKLNYWAAEQVRENLKILDKASHVLPWEVILAEEPYGYYAGENGNYVTDTRKAVVAGPALCVDLKGFAKIQIGNSPVWGSMINSVRLRLVPNASAEDIQRTLAVMGLAEIVTQATKRDMDRIIMNTLIRFHEPRFAAIHDTDRGYHEQPLSVLLTKLPSDKARKKVNRSFKQIKAHAVCGEKRFGIRHLVDKVENINGKGFVTYCHGHVKETAARIASLFTEGFISTQKRFALGWTHIKGASHEEDLKSNSADGVFFRLLTDSCLSDDIKQGNITSNIQIYAKLKAIELLPYFYNRDEYGSRRRNDNYKNRPDYKSFFIQQQSQREPNNEIIFKNQLQPKYLCAITYQDPRKTIVMAIEKLGRSSLFSNCSSLQEKADKVSQLYFSNHPSHKQQLLEALDSQLLNRQSETYREAIDMPEKKLETHWVVDPKAAIESYLNASDKDLSHIPIIETDSFTREVFLACHQPLDQKVRKMALTTHFSTRSDLHLRDNYPALIEGMRSHFQKLSTEKLLSYFDESSLKYLQMLKTKCQKYQYNLEYSGQSSLNRELLTWNYNYGLRNSKIVLALYALEEIMLRDIKSDLYRKLWDCLVFKVQKREDEWVQRNIAGCLYYGLLDNPPILLERLPNNQSKGKVLTLNAKQGKMKYLREYIRRTKIQDTFLPVLKAIEIAYESLLQQKLPAKVVENSLFNSSYEHEKWKQEYPAVFLRALEMIEQTSEKKLLALFADHFTPEQLLSQVERGFHWLMACENKYSENMAFEEIITFITESDYLLDQEIGHLFFDRLHLLAALKSDDSACFLAKTGSVSWKQLMIGIFKSFEKGVNEKNSIAAEQCYLRMLQIYKTLFGQ